MAIDPRKMKPTELVRLLNSTPLGEVISERQLHRHRARAGFRIGDGRTIDLLRYTARLRMTLEEHGRQPDVQVGWQDGKQLLQWASADRSHVSLRSTDGRNREGLRRCRP